MGIREELARLLSDETAVHRRLVEYIAREVGDGRQIGDVLEDPYVVNRAAALGRYALLEEPSVVAAVGEEVVSTMRRRLEEDLQRG